MTFRPSKWLVYSPVAILPFLAAFALNTGTVIGNLKKDAEAQLAASGADWARLKLDGRDALISGDSPSAEAIDAAVRAVAGTHGIRLVESAARVVEPPPKVEMIAPTVNAVSALAGDLLITGTWHEGVATSLKAMLDGKAWTLGDGPALTSDGKGNWTLKPDIELAPGTYDLVIETADAAGTVVRDAGTGDITIVAPPPPPPEMKPPTVKSVETNSSTPAIRGTWDSAIATTLRVKVGELLHVLGQGDALKAEGDAWTLTLPAPLADGEFDISVETADAAGKIMGTAAPGRLTIDTVAPAAPTIAPLESSDGAVVARGTWAEGDAVSLVAKLAGEVWTLGKDAVLSSDGKGAWTLAPELKLEPGTYDLEIEIADKLGNVSRDSTRDEIVIAPPPPPPPAPQMTAPTVMATVETVARPVVRGTWPEAAATSLSVSLAGATYVLGTDEALKSDGAGNWTLTVPVPLKDGVHDVAVEARDASGRTFSDATRGELSIDAVGPSSPTVMPSAGQESPTRISGGWDWENAAKLKVSIPAATITATLGQDPALTSASGVWSLALNRPLAPGSYDVVAETTDARGRVSSDQTRFEILVKEPPPPPPPPPPLKAPTVMSYAGEGVPSDIRGTWDEGSATILKIAIPQAGLAAVLGSDEELRSDGAGNWSLALPATLSPGAYDIAVETSDGAGRVTSQVFADALDIKAPPPPPPPLKAPTVLSYAGVGVPSAILGTWDEGEAKTLKVGIPMAGLSAVLGVDEALKSDGSGNWSLTLPATLEPGTYDVAVETTDGAERVIGKLFAGAIVIKAPPPPPPPPPPPLKAPTILPYAGEGVPSAILGTWDEGQAKTLKVVIPQASISAALGADAALNSDGSGNWSLELPQTLAPGVYDVTVETSDGADRTASEIFASALDIRPVPPPYDCAGALVGVSDNAHIRFGFDSTVLEPPYDAAVKAAADLLNDPRCTDRKAVIEGHADYLGGRLYNEALGIARAQTVLNALVERGVAPARLRILGKGERSPDDPVRSKDARSKNRRVTITIVE